MNITELTDGARNVEIPEAEVTEKGETRTVNTRFGTEAVLQTSKLRTKQEKLRCRYGTTI